MSNIRIAGIVPPDGVIEGSFTVSGKIIITNGLASFVIDSGYEAIVTKALPHHPGEPLFSVSLKKHLVESKSA